MSETGVEMPVQTLKVIVFGISVVGTAMILVLAAWLFPVGVVQALTCDVPTETHPSIQSAVGDPACDVVNLIGPLYLENVTITRNLTIQGQGAMTTTVDGGGNGRVFTIQPGLAVTLTDMAITNGRITNFNSGAGIYNDGANLTIRSSTVISNSAGYRGGAIYNDGALTLMNSTIVSNSAVYGGGGIYSTDTLTVTGSWLIDNFTTGSGGAIGNIYGVLLVTDSVLNNNSAEIGGAIDNVSVTPTLVRNSTFSGNVADSSGGAIHNYDDSPLIIIDSTFHGNSAYLGGGIFNNGHGIIEIHHSNLNNNSAHGGAGIYSAGTITVTNSTLSNNSAESYGGAIATASSGFIHMLNSTLSGNAAWSIYTYVGIVELNNSIIAYSPLVQNCNYGVDLISLGYNISDDDSCNLNAPGDLVNTDPLLGPLQDNGGPTWTRALLENSPAIDTGDDSRCPNDDQRGVPRPSDGDGDGSAVCDRGAFELEGAEIPLYKVYLPALLNQGD
jgi:predicted outer membrane repeat protein